MYFVFSLKSRTDSAMHAHAKDRKEYIMNNSFADQIKGGWFIQFRGHMK